MNSIKSTYRGYKIFDQDLNNLPQSSKILINTINQYSFCIAEEDSDFKNALSESDILLPDGVGIVLAVKATSGLTIKKISGAQLHQQQLGKLNAAGGRCFYLGSSESTLSKIKSRLSIEYPNVECECYSPPFKKEFSEDDNTEMIEKVNSFKPDVLFVGMTAPKQEKWTFAHKDELDANVICSIGAVFDFFAGTVSRPSDFWIKIGLEWFIRLCKEPKRMWKRYLYYGPIFIGILLKDIITNDITTINSIKLQQKGMPN
jgi:N-acetylglucosaminyldiphosphoundecaprenol N-acetyl-beta-D-mannosaminyltransferase